MRKLALDDTHWIQWDSPKIGDLKRAVCGVLTNRQAPEPSCPDCKKYLEDVAQQTVESRFG